MKKIIPFICILIFLIVNLSALATQSSDEYIECLSEKLYKECEMGINICEDGIKGGCPNELQPFTKQSIFNWLKNYENQFTDSYGNKVRLYVFACKIQDDFMRLERHGSDGYTLGGKLTACPKNTFNFYLVLKIGVPLSLSLYISLRFNTWRKRRKKKPRKK